MSVKIQPFDTLISFYISLFTNVPVDEVLQVISNEFHNNDNLVVRSVLHVEANMELLQVSLRTSYFLVDDKFLKQLRCHGYWEFSITHR
jgi:hypothetical protein